MRPLLRRAVLSLAALVLPWRTAQAGAVIAGAPRSQGA